MSEQRRRARARWPPHARDEIARPLQDYSSRLEADGFAMINAWELEQRRRILAELQSLRRLEFLMFELDMYLSRVPGAAPSVASWHIWLGGRPAVGPERSLDLSAVRNRLFPMQV